MINPRKEGEPGPTPKETDELEEYFRDQRHIDHSRNLGFHDREEVAQAIASLQRLVTHPEVSERVIGKYQGILEGQLALVDKRQVSRRRLVKSLVFGGTGIAGATLLYSNCFSPEVYRKAAEEEQRKNQELENRRTLGLTTSSTSYYGWSVRYGQKREGLQYEDVGITFTVGSRKFVKYAKSPLLASTGLWLDSHVRSTDGKLVPKLYVRTNSAEESSGGSDDLWLLRATDDTDPLVDPQVVILENDKDPVLRPLRFYASIDPIDGGKAFDFKLKRPVDPNQRR